MRDNPFRLWDGTPVVTNQYGVQTVPLGFYRRIRRERDRMRRFLRGLLRELEHDRKVGGGRSDTAVVGYAEIARALGLRPKGRKP